MRQCHSKIIAKHCIHIDLIQRGPILKSITKFSEAHIIICCEIFPTKVKHTHIDLLATIKTIS